MKHLARLSWLLVLCIGCGGSGAGGDASPPDAAETGCRSSADCSAPQEGCVGPNDVFCGIPPREECAGDQDCGAGTVCHAIPDSCSVDGIGSSCNAPCSPGQCGDGFVCAATGQCMPVACDDQEFDCSPSEICDPSSIDPSLPVHAITHGCTVIPCQDDAPCPSATVCVNGYCQDGPGTCSPPAP